MLRKFFFSIMCFMFFFILSNKDHLKRKNYLIFSFCLFCNSKTICKEILLPDQNPLMGSSPFKSLLPNFINLIKITLFFRGVHISWRIWTKSAVTPEPRSLTSLFMSVMNATVSLNDEAQGGVLCGLTRHTSPNAPYSCSTDCQETTSF